MQCGCFGFFLVGKPMAYGDDLFLWWNGKGSGWLTVNGV